jgi:hypothetical protein
VIVRAIRDRRSRLPFERHIFGPRVALDQKTGIRPLYAEFSQGYGAEIDPFCPKSPLKCSYNRAYTPSFCMLIIAIDSGGNRRFPGDFRPIPVSWSNATHAPRTRDFKARCRCQVGSTLSGTPAFGRLRPVSCSDAPHGPSTAAMRRRWLPVRGSGARNAGSSRKPGFQQDEVVPRTEQIENLAKPNQRLPTDQDPWPVNGHRNTAGPPASIPTGWARAILLPSRSFVTVMTLTLTEPPESRRRCRSWSRRK